MKKLMALCAAAVALGLSGCGDDVTKVYTTSCAPTVFVTGSVTTPAVAPPCTVPVNFTMDDTAAQSFGPGEAQWKGSWKYDAITRIGYYDAGWSGPFPPLYDDGPWTTGGHEPIGEVAGDHVFGATMFVQVPEEKVTYAYGLIDHTFGDGWIWPGSQNGGFDVLPDATAAIDAQGVVRPAPGTTNLKLVLDTAALKAPATGTWDTSEVRVKGLAWGWFEVPMYDDGTHGDATAADGKWTFQLSDWTGPGKPARGGLLTAGEWPFVFVFGPDGANEKEYKSPSPPTEGVTAFLKTGAGAFTATTVTTQPAGDKNTLVTVP